jgi:hypothetical protein
MIVQRGPVFYFDTSLCNLGFIEYAAIEYLLLLGWTDYSFKLPDPIGVFLI